MDDFDPTAFEVTFPRDEGTSSPPISFVPAPILIDDEKDEADSQFFVVYLELLDAVNLDQITVTRVVSNCNILDNDCELAMLPF